MPISEIGGPIRSPPARAISVGGIVTPHDRRIERVRRHSSITSTRACRLTTTVSPLQRIKWVVCCKAPFAGPEQVLRYLSPYTHRVAISNRASLQPTTARLRSAEASKRSDAPYRGGPSKAWVKPKNPESDAVRREREEEWR